MRRTFFLLSAVLMTTFSACKKDNPQPEKKEDVGPAPVKEGITLPVSGHYVWEFEIPGVGTQESHLVFYTDSVGYVMSGPAYSTNYMMIPESYEGEGAEKRWIGVGKGGSIPKDGVYFVMFFKDITERTVTVYKRECKGGAEEAKSFPYPDADAKEDHGWNVYRK